MSTTDNKTKVALGFLTVVEHPQQGLCGGYLLLNRTGRPLEFHCTVPIKASRAQEILYGPTLTPFLYGEQIGQTLLAKSRAQPILVCTDREPVLAVQELTDLPVFLVLPREEGSSEPPPATIAAVGKKGSFHRIDSPHKHGATFAFQLGRNRIALGGRSEEACAACVQDVASLMEAFDLTEPFARIREAIEEAQKAAR